MERRRSPSWDSRSFARLLLLVLVAWSTAALAAVGVEDACPTALKVAGAAASSQEAPSKASRYQGACEERLSDEYRDALDVHQAGIQLLEKMYGGGEAAAQQ